MKYLLLSDIHGSSYYLNKVLEIVNLDEFDNIILLGDVLYHGPRNDLPKGYNPKEVIKILNGLKEKIIWVRGNCDAEVDEMVLDFKCNDHLVIEDELYMYLTHGHKNGPDNPVERLALGSIVLYGHTHVHKIEEINGTTYINPGSVSIPKEDGINSFGIIEGKSIEIRDLNNKVILSFLKK